MQPPLPAQTQRGRASSACRCSRPRCTKRRRPRKTTSQQPQRRRLPLVQAESVAAPPCPPPAAPAGCQLPSLNRSSSFRQPCHSRRPPGRQSCRGLKWQNWPWAQGWLRAHWHLRPTVPTSALLPEASFSPSQTSVRAPPSRLCRPRATRRPGMERPPRKAVQSRRLGPQRASRLPGATPNRFASCSEPRTLIWRSATPTGGSCTSRKRTHPPLASTSPQRRSTFRQQHSRPPKSAWARKPCPSQRAV
mmetsp:Transcript_24176/g.91238  ORF Transcript_24176/g.91238 Transcript_24176/m.91238 type:complete len:248 (+) Transcript_24176:378-1121(+)